MSRRVLLIPLLGAWHLLAVLPSPALAYLDPNTGNLIFQILFPIITALATAYLFCKKAVQRLWAALKERLGKLRRH
jgi:hypothetical protein